VLDPHLRCFFVLRFAGKPVREKLGGSQGWRRGALKFAKFIKLIKLIVIIMPPTSPHPELEKG
jgi:hypothetical protein